MSGVEVGHTKFRSGQNSGQNNGYIEFEKSKMSGLTKFLLFIAGAIMVVGMISCVVMLGILVRDKNSGNDAFNAGNTGAQVDATTTPAGEYKAFGLNSIYFILLEKTF